MYKTKTLVKFVDNCSLFLLRSKIMFEPFLSDFKTILTGSSFLGLRSSVFVLYSPQDKRQIEKLSVLKQRTAHQLLKSCVILKKVWYR